MSLFPPKRSRQIALCPRRWQSLALLTCVILSGARSAESKDLLSPVLPLRSDGKQVLRLHSAVPPSAQEDGVEFAQSSAPAFEPSESHANQQQPPPADPPQTATPPKGKVLFERHEPAVTDTPAASPSIPDADAPPEVTPTGKPGISSSSKRSRTTLHRHDEPPTVVKPATAPAEAPAADGSAVSSSAADDLPQAAVPVVLTARDRDAASRVSDAERTSVAVTAVNLDLHLNAHTGAAEVRAQLTVRNTSDAPLQRVPLRISGALQWESARAEGAALPLDQHRLPDDLDHTGVASELAVTLKQPLAPGASVALDLYYGGTLTASAQRLLALGAPASRAALTDWDTVTDTFTGLRGMGEVLWYPVAGAPALLRDGSAVPDAVEASRTRDAAGSFHLRLTLEFAPRHCIFLWRTQGASPVGRRSQPDKRERRGRRRLDTFAAGSAYALAFCCDRRSRGYRHRSRHEHGYCSVRRDRRSRGAGSTHAVGVARSRTGASVAGT